MNLKGVMVLTLTTKDETILSALLCCGTVANASRLSGVKRSIIKKRLEDKTFKAELDRRYTAMFDEVCSEI